MGFEEISAEKGRVACKNLSAGEVRFIGRGAKSYIGVNNQGIIISDGDTGPGTGFRNNGTVIIVNNAGDGLGRENEGVIIVGGNVKGVTGINNTGLIIVCGTIEHLDESAEGTVYAGKVKRGRLWKKLEKGQIEVIKKAVIQMIGNIAVSPAGKEHAHTEASVKDILKVVGESF